MIERLELEHVTAYYDSDTRIIHIRYHGLIDAQTPTEAYGYIHRVIETVGFDNIYGQIFDFREVVEFSTDNLMEARKKSRRLNMRRATQRLPVAMIVKDFYQEEILRGPMQNVPENQRKAIVTSMDEALQFFEQWHRVNSPEL